jgi:hypothetical protein
VWWNGSLLSLATSDPLLGYLVKINPATGEITAIGATGLGSNAFSFAKVGGKLYLTDFSNNLYSVDPQTGAATFIGQPGFRPTQTLLLPPTPMAPSIFAMRLSLALAENCMRPSIRLTCFRPL